MKLKKVQVFQRVKHSGLMYSVSCPIVPHLKGMGQWDFIQESDMTGNNASVTRGRPFAKGNAGRPKGAEIK